jgi:endonuclease G
MTARRPYTDRRGYDPGFLGVPVPMPSLSPAARDKAFRLDGVAGADAYELKYHNFSVIMNREARLAFVAAVNLNAAAKFRQTREGSDRWFRDPRLDEAFQAGNEFYSDNPLDRGHLVRRADAAWGSTAAEAAAANEDTFHFTNCSPQHEIFNQARKAQKQDLLLWGNIEEYIAGHADTDRQRVSIFNGPVLRASDRVHRGLRVPREFWKIVVSVVPGPRKVKALAFILSQESLIADLPLEAFVAGPYRPFQMKVRAIENRTGLRFADLKQSDPLETGAFESASAAVPLSSVADIIM